MLNLDTKQIWWSHDIKWIAPSLPAYTTLQLACLKAGKQEDNENNEPSVKPQSLPNADLPPLAHQGDANNDVDNDNLNADEDDDAQDEDDDHPPVTPCPIKSISMPRPFMP